MSLLFATTCLVFLRAWQQQNVIHGHYWMAAITSYGLAIADITLLLGIVATGWPAVPWVGTGGAIGVTLAMTTHRRMRKRSTT